MQARSLCAGFGAIRTFRSRPYSAGRLTPSAAGNLVCIPAANAVSACLGDQMNAAAVGAALATRMAHKHSVRGQSWSVVLITSHRWRG